MHLHLSVTTLSSALAPCLPTAPEYDALKYTLKKLENTLYELSLTKVRAARARAYKSALCCRYQTCCQHPSGFLAVRLPVCQCTHSHPAAAFSCTLRPAWWLSPRTSRSQRAAMRQPAATRRKAHKPPCVPAALCAVSALLHCLVTSAARLPCDNHSS